MPNVGQGTFEVYERTFEFINSKLSEGEFQIALNTANELLRSTPVGAAQQETRARCLLLIGDCMAGLKDYTGALQIYDEARVTAERFSAPDSPSMMQLLFKMEKLLALKAEMRTVASVSPDLVGFLAGEQHEVKKPDTDLSQEELDRLWKQALEDAPKEAKKPFFVGDPKGWLIDLYSKICTKPVEDFLFKLTALFGIVMAGMIVVQTLRSVLIFPLPEDMKKLERYDGTNMLIFDSPTGKSKLQLLPNQKAVLKTKHGEYKGPVIIYDGSFVSSFMSIVAANFGPSLTYQYEHSTLVDPSGQAFHDDRSADYDILTRMDDLASGIQSYIGKFGEYPDKVSDCLIYFDPYSGHGERMSPYEVPAGMSVKNALATVRNPKQCSLLLFTHPLSPNHEFEIVFFEISHAAPEYRDANGWHLVSSGNPVIFPKVNEKPTFIICETKMDEVTKFLSEGFKVKATVVGLLLTIMALIAVMTGRRKKAQVKPKDDSDPDGARPTRPRPDDDSN